VAEEFDTLVVFARIAGSASDDGRPLLPESASVVELPQYGSLRRIGSVARAGVRTSIAFWRGLAEVDLVWAFGPHPFELILVTLARARGKRVVLGVRQDTPAYFRARLPSARWRPILAGVALLDRLHRLQARRLAATVVGAENVRRYGRRGGRVLHMQPTLVAAADVVPAPREHDWYGTVTLLTVGRIDPEKNPLLLVDAIAELERLQPGRYRLCWVGVGPLSGHVERRAQECGVADRIELKGYVPYGPGLLRLYREAHVFVHVSLTEGVPQVLAEALASGTPIVATDVGGVRAALDEGAAGLLVPPDDREALVTALIRLADDSALRERLVRHGLELARGRTIEAEAARVARFLREAGNRARPA
jgi:glycosyltransferase involved in cell wall biosynthesis